MQETKEAQVQSLGWEDPLEQGTGTHCSITAWRIPWTEKFGRLRSTGSQRVGHDWSDWEQIPSCWASQVAQWWRICLPMWVMREAWVWSLGQEDPLEKETAAHSSILAWKIPWTEEPGGLQSMGLQAVRHSWVTEHTAPSFILSRPPLNTHTQYSENTKNWA